MLYPPDKLTFLRIQFLSLLLRERYYGYFGYIGPRIVWWSLIFCGIQNYRHLKIMAELTKSKGMPVPTLCVVVASAICILGGISILANYQIKIGVLLVWIFLLPSTLIIHNFWTVKDPMEKGNEMGHFLKNLLILAGALIFLALPAT